MTVVKRKPGGVLPITRARLEEMLAAAKIEQGTAYARLVRPGGPPIGDFGLPTSGGGFEHTIMGFDELLAREGLEFSRMVKPGWVCSYGPGRSFPELPFLLGRLPQAGRIFAVEAQKDCVDAIAREYLLNLPPEQQTKFVLINGDAGDLRWALPDRCLKLGFFFHLYDTMQLDDERRQAITSEAARTLAEDGIIVAIDLKADLIQEQMNAVGVKTLAYMSSGIFLGTPDSV